MWPALRDVVLVALGGAFGSALRYVTTVAAARLIGPEYPYGTLAVNLMGSFVAGFVFHVAAARLIPPAAALFVMVGVLGGLTTYSAFSVDTMQWIWRSGEWRKAALYVALTTTGALALCSAGMYAAARLVGDYSSAPSA